VAQHYLNDPEGFQQTAAEWTRIHATEENSYKEQMDPAVARLMEMGFDKRKVLQALKQTNFNEQRAVDMLLTGV
jgi:Holliday junction resolvasome RuvABC DNA-binding subunit